MAPLAGQGAQRPGGEGSLAAARAVASQDEDRQACRAPWGVGHRKIWAMTRRDGVQVSPSTVLRALREENLL